MKLNLLWETYSQKLSQSQQSRTNLQYILVQRLDHQVKHKQTHHQINNFHHLRLKPQQLVISQKKTVVIFLYEAFGQRVNTV